MGSASTASRRYVLRRNVLAYDAPDWERSGPIDDDEAGNREDSRPCRRQPFFSARMQPFHQPPRKQPFRQPPHATVLGRGYLGGPARNPAINPPVCNPTINPPVCNPAISPGIRPRREPEGPRRGISS